MWLAEKLVVSFNIRFPAATFERFASFLCSSQFNFLPFFCVFPPVVFVEFVVLVLALRFGWVGTIG
jgi:hypothetical protein